MIYTLSDGINVETSDRGVTGYLGATYSPAWTLSDITPFIGMASNPKEPHLISLLCATERQSLHLGHYADPREAAYVVGLYKDDPENTLRYFQQYNTYVDFPMDLYDLPLTYSIEDARRDNSLYRATKKKQRKIDNKPVDGNVSVLTKRYGKKIFLECAELTSKEEIINDRKTLTILEFEEKYKLA